MDELERMLRQLLEDEAPALLEENRLWADKVPERLNRSAALTIASIGAPGLSLPPAGTVLRSVLGVAAAAAVAGGALAGARYVRTRIEHAADPPAVTAAARAERRSPGDYAVPSPGEGFTVRDEIATQSLNYRWFEGDRGRAVLVEIASRLPGGNAAGAETVSAGGVSGQYYRDGGADYFVFSDGAVTVLISYMNGDREALLEYASALAEANGIR